MTRRTINADRDSLLLAYAVFYGVTNMLTSPYPNVFSSRTELPISHPLQYTGAGLRVRRLCLSAREIGVILEDRLFGFENHIPNCRTISVYENN